MRTNYAGRPWEETPRSETRTLSVPFGRGAYAALLDSPLGGAAVFSLTDGLEATVSPPARGRITFSLPPGASPKRKGETAYAELLLVGIPRLTDQTRRLPASSNEVVVRFMRDYGLDGGTPGYSVAPTMGAVREARYPLRVDSVDGGFSATLTGDLCSSLPIAVSGLNDNWSAFLLDRGQSKARPVGVFEQAAWATVCLHGELDLFLGHPVVADSAEVFIQVTQTGDDAWAVEVHNPTDHPVTTTVRANPGFDPLAGKLADRTLTLAPGTSQQIAL